MNGKIPVIISLTLLFSLLVGPSANSRESWTPGVTSGDYFTYQMYGIYASTRQNLSLAIPEFEKNTTSWARINITGVSGSTIYQIYTLHYVDGRESTFVFQTDVNPHNQGTFKIADKGVPICAANLTRGEKIPTAELILNGTVIREYFDGLRLTSYARWNFSDDWGDIYFDHNTGVMVELRRTHVFANEVTGEVVEKTDVIKLLDTNRWQISGT